MLYLLVFCRVFTREDVSPLLGGLTREAFQGDEVRSRGRLRRGGIQLARTVARGGVMAGQQAGLLYFHSAP